MLDSAFVAYRARKALGAYFAVLGRADAVLFGGGIGEHMPRVRAGILEGLGFEVQHAGHGREGLAPDLDLSRTVGWFTSAYPLRLTPHNIEEAAGQGASIKAIVPVHMLGHPADLAPVLPLAAEHGAGVRLWVDDVASLARIWPGVDANMDMQRAAGVVFQ